MTRHTAWLKRSAKILCLLGVLPLLSLAQRPAEVPTLESLLDPSLRTLKIADVGPVSITGLEFKLGYEFAPAFIKRVKDSKLRCLNFMIDEKLLALEAAHRGLDGWPDVGRQLSELEGDFATEELYRADVLKHAAVSDRAIAEGVEAERVHLKIEWIFTPEADAMNDAVKRMRSGVPFDTLYREQFRTGSVNVEDRSMEMTRFHVRMKNPMLGSIVDTMRAGSVSLPVHTPDGWYCVRVAAREREMLLTETAEADMRTRVRRALVQHVSDSLSDRYVHELIASRSPVIQRRGLEALAAYLGKRFCDSAQYRAMRLWELDGARGLADVGDLSPRAADTLVAMKHGSFSVNDFLEWFRMREPYARLAIASKAALMNSVQEIIWRMVRDRLLTRRAYERHMQNRPGVKRQLAWWKQKLLYTAEKHRLGDTIIDSLPLLQSYYDGHQREFMGKDGRVTPFADAHDDVWKNYYAQEFTKQMLHEILRLKQQYAVSIDDAALGRIPVDDADDPKTIDVYSVKKGGTYPHEAFPSIDRDWQSWN